MKCLGHLFQKYTITYTLQYTSTPKEHEFQYEIPYTNKNHQIRVYCYFTSKQHTLKPVSQFCTFKIIKPSDLNPIACTRLTESSL